MSTVCCLTKIAPYENCVPPSDFQMDGCEMPKIMPMCTKPSDCAAAGNVCCISSRSAMVSCQPPTVCPGNDGYTYIICETDSDCPSKVSGSCQAPDGGPLGQVSICM